MTGRRISPSPLTGAQGTPGHPALGFDDTVHQRTRLAILAVLAEAGQADFPYLRTVLGLTDGNLGRHLQILDDARLVTISKGYHHRRPRTWATITNEGRRALRTELATMQALLERLGTPPNLAGPPGHPHNDIGGPLSPRPPATRPAVR